MGYSSSAYLAFGVDLGDELPWDDDDDLADFLAERAGLKNPYADIPDDVNYGGQEKFEVWKAAHPEFELAQEEWWEQRRRLEDEAPIELLCYGHFEYSQYALVLKGTEISAYGYGAEAVSLDDLQTKVREKDVAKAAEFCEEHGLPAFENPSWLLVSSYG